MLFFFLVVPLEQVCVGVDLGVYLFERVQKSVSVMLCFVCWLALAGVLYDMKTNMSGCTKEER